MEEESSKQKEQPAGVLRKCGSSSVRTGSSARPRNILFVDKTQVHYIPNMDEYTQEEVRNCWFESFEYSQIKANNRVLTEMMNQGGFTEDESTYCFRGLEFKTSVGSKVRRSCKRSAAFAVFSEQLRQWDEEGGMTNWELVRQVYQSFTDASNARAHKNGLKDQAIMVVEKESDNEANVENIVPSSSSNDRAPTLLAKSACWCPDANSVLTEECDDISMHPEGDGEEASSSSSSTSTCSDKSISSTNAIAGPSPHPKGLRVILKKASRKQRVH